MKILCIPDLHIPFEHPQALEFVTEMVHKYRPQQIIQMGDMVDFYCFNMHSKSPDAISARQELDETREKVALWESYFPGMRVLTGNHESRLARKMMYNDILPEVAHNLESVVGFENIEYEHRIEIDDVIFTHGKVGGEYAAKNMSMKTGQSVVMGHCHTNFFAYYMTFGNGTRVGVNCGALVDNNSFAFAYSDGYLRESIPGVVIIDTETLDVTMERLI